MKSVESKWLGRSLANYKSMQAPVAKIKGVSRELEDANTLTEARKIVYGNKKGAKRRTNK